MSLLFGNKKKILIEKQNITIGEFDINVDGAYRNVKTFPLEVKKGRKVFVSIESDNDVDVSIVGLDGRNVKFIQGTRKTTLGPIESPNRGTMALIIAVNYGDLSHADIEAWME